jgi:hypothetical protein
MGAPPVTLSKIDKLLRPVAAVLAICVLGAAATYYLDLGWFGRWGKLVLSVSVLFVCFFLIWSQRVSRKTR